MRNEVKIIEPHNGTWQTRTTADGRSYQATKINSKWYFQYTYGFSGGAKQAQEHMTKYHPTYNIIIEQFGSGLAMVLVEAD
jgi:hypothetical protein